MNGAFVALLMASAQDTAPDPPTTVSLTTYSASLVRVSWANANGGTKQSRVYRKTKSNGAWSLRDTVAAGVTSYDTGDSAASNYFYGMSHFDPTTGFESAVVTAEDLTPSAPTGVSQYTYSVTKLGLEWTNTESMPVRCYRNSVLVTTKATGETTWNSGYTSGTLEVSHYNSTTGQESEKVGPA